jgi:hypothetical protein
MSARQSTRDASMADAARNERRAARAQAAYGLVLALATAAAIAVALVSYATPCVGGSLC